MNTKPFRVALIALALAFGFAGSAAGECRFVAALKEGWPQKIVCYGTSLTVLSSNWVDGLQEALDARWPGLATVVNSGLSGKNSATGLANVQTKVVAHNPDAVLIEFSMNDAADNLNKGKTAEQALADAESNLKAIIAAILAGNPDCEIILETMNDYVAVPGSGLSNRTGLADHAAMYRRVAAENGYLLIDHWPKWQEVLAKGEEYYISLVPDGVHPNAQGSTLVTLPNLLLTLGITDKWVEETATMKSVTGAWLQGISYGEDGKASVFDNAFTPYDVSTGNVVTVETKAQFCEDIADRTPVADAQAAVRLSTNGCFQVWSGGSWLDVVADGVMPVSGAEYTLRTTFDYSARTYSVEVKNASEWLPLKSSTPNSQLSTSSSFSLAFSTNCVSSIGFVGDTLFTSMFGVSELPFANYILEMSGECSLKGDKPFFILSHRRHHFRFCSALREYRNAIAFMGHWHWSNADWKTIFCDTDTFGGFFPHIQVASCRFDGGNGVDPFDDKQMKAKEDSSSWAGHAHDMPSRQAMIVNVYDDMVVFERHEVGEGGKLGPDWVLPLGEFKPHPFSLKELQKAIGAPEFGKKAKLDVAKAMVSIEKAVEGKKPRTESGIRISIPMAAGNPASRAFAYNVVVAGDAPKDRFFKSAFFSGLNSGIGHEPNHGVTTVEIPQSQLPAGKKLTIAVRPVSSLGTKGKSITTTFIA